MQPISFCHHPHSSLQSGPQSYLIPQNQHDFYHFSEIGLSSSLLFKVTHGTTAPASSGKLDRNAELYKKSYIKLMDNKNAATVLISLCLSIHLMLIVLQGRQITSCWLFKTTAIYFLTVPQKFEISFSELKSNCCYGWLLLEALAGDLSFPVSGACLQILWTFTHIPLSSCFHHLTASVSLISCLPYKEHYNQTGLTQTTQSNLPISKFLTQS